MSEDSEEACLVRPRSPSVVAGTILSSGGKMPYTHGPHQGPQQTIQQQNQSSTRCSQSHESESGELIDFNEVIVMSQFHADAIKQAGCGKFQIIAAIVTGLGLAGHTIQVYAVFYILPSAEVEYCILDNEKNWLGSITLLGLIVGAFFWAGLASRSGRRKALLSCMAVSAVFSVIAAFMPTYGPFMMARFCSAAGFGGVLPAAPSYLSELTPANRRARIIGFLGALGVAGGILAGGFATVMVPETGQMVILENKEHFSAWHRYLLFCTLPTIFAILGLFWLPESPRFLLENGREVEALTIYQKIYRNNRTRGGYSLTELELPGTRRNNAPSSVLAGMAQSINLFYDGFVQIFKKPFTGATLKILATWLTAIFVYHGLTIFVADYSKSIQSKTYNIQTMQMVNMNYENLHFNTSLDNIIYTQCRFVNCTFSRIFISHVKFNDCTFSDSDFTNVKTSRTRFHNCTLLDVKLIDTDLTNYHFEDCLIQNSTVIRLATQCDRDFEFNIYLETIWKSHLGSLIPSTILLLIVGEFIQRFGGCLIAKTCFIFSTIFSITFAFLTVDEQVIWTAGVAQGLLLAGLAALTAVTVENYSTPLRCTALGLFVCSGHIGALIAGPVYSLLPLTTTNLAAAISITTMIIPISSTFLLKEPSMLL